MQKQNKKKSHHLEMMGKCKEKIAPIFPSLKENLTLGTFGTLLSHRPLQVPHTHAAAETPVIHSVISQSGFSVIRLLLAHAVVAARSMPVLPRRGRLGEEPREQGKELEKDAGFQEVQSQPDPTGALKHRGHHRAVPPWGLLNPPSVTGFGLPPGEAGRGGR